MPTANQTAQYNLFRLLTGEHNIAVVPDTDLDILLQDGCDALNRRIGYHWKDASLTVVAATQNITLPTDFVKAAYLYYQGARLTLTGLPTWEKECPDWQTKAGTPEDWAVFGDKLALRPIPTALDVARSATATLRYIARPLPYGANGPSGLLDQDLALPVYWAVHLWSSAHPDSADAVRRSGDFQKLFVAEADAAAAIYAARRLSP